MEEEDEEAFIRVAQLKTKNEYKILKNLSKGNSFDKNLSHLELNIYSGYESEDLSDFEKFEILNLENKVKEESNRDSSIFYKFNDQVDSEFYTKKKVKKTLKKFARSIQKKGIFSFLNGSVEEERSMSLMKLQGDVNITQILDSCENEDFEIFSTKNY
jgi:hypothetical protein